MKTVQELAHVIYKEAITKETAITKFLSDIVGKCNGYLEGLEFRIKSETSLVRKIESIALLDDIEIEEASKAIKDALRYTVIFELDTFGQDYDQMRMNLTSQWAKIQAVKNTWLLEGPYKGINTFVEKDGFTFEIQYHTQESFELKNGRLHELYEERRLPETSPRRRAELDREMFALSKQLKIPNGIEGVESL